MNKTLFGLFLILSITACQAQPQQSDATKPLSDRAELEAQIDALVKAYQQIDIFSGVVLLAQKGKPVYHKAFGMADRTDQIPNTIHTKFDIGSMNKTFTKVVILQLMEAGKLRLTDKLGQFLEGFPAEAAGKITIRDLLQHSSGYGDYVSREFFDLPVEQKTIAALVERIKRMPLLFEPGTERTYSNSGYILLGAIIEKVSGMTYQNCVKQKIIEPLELNETYVGNKNEAPQRAIGYFKTMTGELEDNTDFVELANPDGGFQSTAMDIMRFYREYHYGEKLLKRSTKMQDDFFRQIQEHANTGGAIPHAGGFNGANTVNYEILRDDISLLVFANMDEPVAEQLGVGILAIIRGQQPEQPVLPAVQNVYQAYAQYGIDYVQNNFEQLITNFHPEDPKDMILNSIGYELMYQNALPKAIEIFELNTRLYPEVANVWDSLGEAYRNKGEKNKALQFYKKALALDPEIPSAKKAIAELEKK